MVEGDGQTSRSLHHDVEWTAGPGKDRRGGVAARWIDGRDSVLFFQDIAERELTARIGTPFPREVIATSEERRKVEDQVNAVERLALGILDPSFESLGGTRFGSSSRDKAVSIEEDGRSMASFS